MSRDVPPPVGDVSDIEKGDSNIGLLGDRVWTGVLVGVIKTSVRSSLSGRQSFDCWKALAKVSQRLIMTLICGLILGCSGEG